MRHLKKGRKLKRTSSHKKALMRNLATQLFEFKKIHTTEAKAKELRPFAEKLITKAKRALQKEQQGLLPDGRKIDFHNRREVGKLLMKKAVIQELFDAIAPVVEERNGGYTRIIKTGFRRGDAGRTAIIELVDWSAEQDGGKSIKSKRRRKPQKQTEVEAPADAVEETEEIQDEEAVEATEEAETEEIQDEATEAGETQEAHAEADETEEVKSEEAAPEEEPTEEAKSEEATAEETPEEEKTPDAEKKEDESNEDKKEN